MVVEFELKARVPPERLAALRAALGAPLRVEEHADAYYAHPSRDFAASDEALRVSRRSGACDITYKGPKLDPRTKSRVEIVLPVDDEGQAHALLLALGFRRAREVRKTRECYHVAGFDVALDDVPGLGPFVEVERMLQEGAPRGSVEAEARALLASWGLAGTERRSYLELLEASR